VIRINEILGPRLIGPLARDIRRPFHPKAVLNDENMIKTYGF
jgi:hypothetical protein